jgi:hypothetical protein
MGYEFPTKEELEQHVNEIDNLPKDVRHELKMFLVAQLDFYKELTEVINKSTPTTAVGDDG